HGGSRGGGHRHNDVHIVGDQVGADLVQVGLVGLGVGVIVGVVEGDAALGAHLVEAGLEGSDDLVEGSVVDVVDDAHLIDSAGRSAAGRRRGGSGGGRRPATGQCQRGAGGRAQNGGLEEAAAGDHLAVF